MILIALLRIAIVAWLLMFFAWTVFAIFGIPDAAWRASGALQWAVINYLFLKLLGGQKDRDP